MKIVIVYVFPATSGVHHVNYACRFLHSYAANPPGIKHDTAIVLNGCKANSEFTCMFSAMPGLMFLEHDDSGWDIGAYQKAAREIPCDMMVFLGGSTFFVRPGWLIRMRSVFERHGNAQYGAMGNRGDSAVRVWPHIRTTAFWMHPNLMNSYPTQITRCDQRHPFEHGPECFTSWVKKCGLQSWVITWSKELLWKNWDTDPEGYMRGQQRNLLAGDRMCEPPYFKGKPCLYHGANVKNCAPWSQPGCWSCMTQ